jgi:protoporphyrinogen oxidase
LSADNIIIIGAGPAGMACAYTLAKKGYCPIVIEKEDAPGGLCRTLNFENYLFDIGGHRFLTDSKEVDNLWHEIMGDDLIRVRRLSRIYYRKRYFNYPLSFFNTFWNLGLVESFSCVSSYLKCKYFQHRDDDTFKGWIINRFGKRLYDIFFKTYTEKVWAVPCEDISADWAKQRISGLSLKVAIQKTLLRIKGSTPKTLCEEFLYPERGPGEFYQRLKELLLTFGVKFKFGSNIINIRHDGKKVASVVIEKRDNGEKEELPVDYLFSSMPLPVLMKSMLPQPPEDIIQTAHKLEFRSFIAVNIVLDKENIFPDQWLYIHCPEVKLGRIQNYKNWSRAMALDLKKTSLGLEYFCTEGDSLWRMNDMDMINFALSELEKIGIVSRRHLINGFVIRLANVYPVYSIDYRNNINIIQRYLDRFSNFQTMGRSGLFRYCNSDHALLTGIYCARKLLGENAPCVWEL